MTTVTLAAYSHLAVYSSIVVLTLAMIAFAMDLAGAVPRTVHAPKGRGSWWAREHPLPAATFLRRRRVRRPSTAAMRPGWLSRPLGRVSSSPPSALSAK